MSDNGKNIIATFVQARRFCEEVAKLLQSADAAMAERQWLSLSSQAVTGSSAVNKADEWVPYFAFRYFESEERPSLMPFVGVVFDYYDDDLKLKLMEEPVLLAGWYDYGAEGRREGYILWNVMSHVYVPGWTKDGKIVEWCAKDVVPKSWYKRTSIRCRSFAFPLMSFQSSEDLSQRVVDPLIQDIENSSSMASSK